MTRLLGFISRACALVAAATGIALVSTPASALTVNLVGCPGTGSASYSTISVDVNGTVTVNCGASSSPGTLGVIAPASLDVNATGTFTVTRTGGSTGAATVNVAANAACTTSTAALAWGSGDSTSQPVSVTAGSTAGIACSITLSNASGATLGTSAASVTISNPTAPGLYSLSAPASLVKAFTTTNEVVVKHTGGGSQSPAQAVTFSVAGGCTTSTASPINFGLGDSTDKAIVINTPAGAGAACVVSLLTPVVDAKTINITEPVTGCPTVPNVVDLTLGSKSTPTLVVAGNTQISSLPLPNQAALNKISGVLMFGESSAAYSPNPVVMEVTISKCRGEVSSDLNNKCNLRSTNGNYNELYWWSKPGAGINNQAAANSLGACWAPSSEGDWYINTRFTHNGCAYGAQNCGFALQWGGGPY